MIYTSDLGPLASKDKSGIREPETHPSPLGYSLTIPLARVRKPTVAGAVNINALNFPGASMVRPSIGSLTTMAATATQFASDLYTEAQTWLVEDSLGTVPNYVLVIGGLALLIAFKGGKSRGRR